MQKSGLITGLFLGLSGASAAAPAADAGSSTPGWSYKTVTVFPGNQAEVVRESAITLEGPKKTVRLKGLPGRVQKDTIRAQVPAAGIRIAGVRTEKVTQPAIQPEREKKLTQRLQTLQTKKAKLANRVQSAKQRLAFIDELTKLPEKAASKVLDKADQDGALKTLLNHIEKDGTRTRDKITELNNKKRQIQQRVKAVKKNRQALRTDSRQQTHVALDLQGNTGTEGQVQITYRVQGASWQPQYRARLDTQAGKLTLERAVKVRQKTGEDWQSAQLRLATARPQRGSIPALDTWWIDLAQDKGPRPRAEQATHARLAADRGGGAQANKASPVRTTATEFNTTYTVASPVTLAGDNKPRTYTLGEDTMPVDLRARIAPQAEQKAWLTAETAWPGDTPLPPGSLNRYRDGAYIGEGELATWTPGETRSLAFGVDPRIDVTYEAQRDKSGEEGWLTTSQKVARQYKAVITNNHDRAMPVALRFRMPVSKADKLEVRPAEAMPDPDKRDVGDNPGVMAWQWTLKAGASRSLALGYTVTAPEAKVIEGLD